MTPDFRLQRRILETLCALSGMSIAEKILIDEVALRFNVAPSADEIRDQVAILKEQNLIESERGPLGETRWRRTTKGEAALKDLQG